MIEGEPVVWMVGGSRACDRVKGDLGWLCHITSVHCPYPHINSYVESHAMSIIYLQKIREKILYNNCTMEMCVCVYVYIYMYVCMCLYTVTTALKSFTGKAPRSGILTHVSFCRESGLVGPDRKL